MSTARACAYCGAMTWSSSSVCPAHRDLIALDPNRAEFWHQRDSRIRTAVGATP